MKLERVMQQLNTNKLFYLLRLKFNTKRIRYLTILYNNLKNHFSY